MVYKLTWNYDIGTDDLLDLIYEVEFADQNDLANIMNVSVRTIERKIRLLKNDRLLWIVRDSRKNMYYLLGDDAEKRWSSMECVEILAYRNSGLDMGYEVNTPLNDIDSNRYYYHDMKEVYESKELDDIVDKLISSIKENKNGYN